LRRCRTSGTRINGCSASFVISGAVGAASIVLLRGHPESRRRRGTSRSVIDHTRNICVLHAAYVRSFAPLRMTRCFEQAYRSAFTHAGFSSKLATPMFSASGILGFGLRMRAR
jgi:hypothetical protein